MKITIIGLSITSSWGNGHATTFRGLVRELEKRGHDITFLERDQPWYAAHRDLPEPPYGTTVLYADFDELREAHVDAVRDADLVIVGSYVAEGVRVGEWVQQEAEGVTAFYDIDTPVTLAKMARGDFEYLHPDQIPGYDLYLSFTGGPTLKRLQREFGAPRARALYCSVDPDLYFPEAGAPQWDLGYMGTYSDDRQPSVNAFLLEPARQLANGRFIIAGPQYPDTDRWPVNVKHEPHLPPSEHRAFYTSQRYTLNVTRRDMIAAGFSPSVRLFEAAACGTPIISDRWPGIESLLVPHQEILLVDRTADVLDILERTGEEERLRIAERARKRILAEHTSAHRAAEVEQHAMELLSGVAA